MVGFCSVYDVNEEAQPLHLIERLNNMNFRLWPKGWRGCLKKLTRPLRLLVESKFFSNLMTFVVISNILILALDHHGISEDF